MMEKIEKTRVSDDALDLVFRKARIYNAWPPKPVPDERLRQLYEILKWGPCYHVWIPITSNSGV